MTTDAGKRLLASAWALGPGEPLMADTIAAIESETVAVYRAELAEQVRVMRAAYLDNEKRSHEGAAIRWRARREGLDAVLVVLEPPTGTPEVEW